MICQLHLRSPPTIICIRFLLLCYGALSFLEVSSTSFSESTANKNRAIVLIRGGQFAPQNHNGFVQFIENPIKYDSVQYPLTLGDIENELDDDAAHHLQQSTNTNRRRFKVFVTSLRRYLNQFRQEFRVISDAILICIVIFIGWQVPSTRVLLSNHFVCSRRNIQAGRIHSILLASLSHAGFMHLMYNAVTLVALGPRVSQLFQRLYPHSSRSFEILLLGAALSGSIVYLLLDRYQGGCMGLSGVTLGIMAFYARAYPQRPMGFVLGPFPIRTSAEYALMAIACWSIIRTIQPDKSPHGSGIAHAAHLGGIIFGCLYYEFCFPTRSGSSSKRMRR